MTNDDVRRVEDSGLINLMEAATALTQLVRAPSTVKTSVQEKIYQNPVRDGGGMVSPDHAAMISMLRDNHMKALQAASLDARPVKATIVSQRTGASHGNSVVSRDKETFPMRLHALLADSSVRDVVSWLPHGNSFVILRPDEFALRVLPRYFSPEGSSNSSHVHKYPSFTRKLNRWGFRQIARGADAGAFCHELFRRDTPERCRDMVCQKSRKIRDDSKSVSSASTMSMTSGMSSQKRSVSHVTVSTSGKSGRSLPFKKRRGIATTYESGIPSNVEMKPNNTSLVPVKAPVSSDSDTVSDLSQDVLPGSYAEASSGETATSAVETPIHRVYEQQRAFALATLLENSRKAMLAAGLDIKSSDKALPSSSPAAVDERPESLDSATNSEVLASTLPSITQSCSSQVSVNAAAAAETAKQALFEAYKQALSSST